MKRKSWLFIVYAVLIIGAIVVALVFLPRKDKEDMPNDDTTTYATSLTLNLPSTINLLVRTSAKLESGFVKVLPIEAGGNLIITVEPKYSSPDNGLKFENNILSADNTGTYNLNFEVKKSHNQTIKRSVEVVVHDDESIAHIKQTRNSLIKGEKTSLMDLFEINSIKTYDVLPNSAFDYIDNYIVAKSLGLTVMEIKFVDGYIAFSYKFTFNVKDEPEYRIELTNVVDNRIEIDLLENSSSQIYFAILNRDEEYIEQNVIVKSSDETVLVVEKETPPNIKIRGLKEGVAIITIACCDDESIKVEIEVVVK